MNLPVNLINLIKSKKKKNAGLEKKIHRNRAAEAKSQKNRRCGQDRGGALHATINFDVVRRSADTNTGGWGVGGVNNRGHDRFVIREQTTRSQRGPGPWNNYCACN